MQGRFAARSGYGWDETPRDVCKLSVDIDIGIDHRHGTIDLLMELAESNSRRVVFYGTTIVGAAYLLGLERMCPSST